MVFDLIYRRLDSTVWQEFFKVPFAILGDINMRNEASRSEGAYVANADGFDFPGAD